jgi:hypothetical protein
MISVMPGSLRPVPASAKCSYRFRLQKSWLDNRDACHEDNPVVEKFYDIRQAQSGAVNDQEKVQLNGNAYQAATFT